jgi:hypothetical protein
MIHGSETDMIDKSSGQYRTISTVKLIALIIILQLTTPALQAYITHNLPIALSAIQ